MTSGRPLPAALGCRGYWRDARGSDINDAVIALQPALERVPCSDTEMFRPDPKRPLHNTLVLGTILIGTAALGAVVLYAITGWLWLVIHQGLH